MYLLPGKNTTWHETHEIEGKDPPPHSVCIYVYICLYTLHAMKHTK